MALINLSVTNDFRLPPSPPSRRPGSFPLPPPPDDWYATRKELADAKAELLGKILELKTEKGIALVVGAVAGNVPTLTAEGEISDGGVSLKDLAKSADVEDTLKSYAKTSDIETLDDDFENRLAVTKNDLQYAIGTVSTALVNHRDNKDNPHGVTAAQVDAYTIGQVNGLISPLASKTELDTAVKGLASKTELDTAVKGLASKTELDTAVKGLASETYVSSQLAGYVTKTQIVPSDTELGYAANAVAATTASKAGSAESATTATVASKLQAGDGTVSASDLALKSELASKADLVDGKVPSSQLPSYVSSVVNADDKSKFPAQGETDTIYIAQDTNLTYRWSGTSYVEISPSIALGETSATAYAGDKGKALSTSLDAHLSAKDNPHGVTAAQVDAYTTAETDTKLKLKQDTISDLGTIRSGAAKGATALQTAPVTSVNSKTGAVTLIANDFGAWDLTKENSTATTTQSVVFMNEQMRERLGSISMGILGSSGTHLSIQDYGGTAGGTVSSISIYPERISIVDGDESVSMSWKNILTKNSVQQTYQESGALNASPVSSAAIADYWENYAGLEDIWDALDSKVDEDFVSTEITQALKPYAKTEEIPSVPTNVGDLTNDAGYVKASDSPVQLGGGTGKLGAVAIGVGADATDNFGISVAIGNNAKATGRAATAVGTGATATDQASTSIGTNAKSHGLGSFNINATKLTDFYFGDATLDSLVGEKISSSLDGVLPSSGAEVRIEPYDTGHGYTLPSTLIIGAISGAPDDVPYTGGLRIEESTAFPSDGPIAELGVAETAAQPAQFTLGNDFRGGTILVRSGNDDRGCECPATLKLVPHEREEFQESVVITPSHGGNHADIMVGSMKLVETVKTLQNSVGAANAILEEVV